MEEICLHTDSERIEQYALGLLPEPETAGFEQHLLICHTCQDALAEADVYVHSMQSAARAVRAQERATRCTHGASL